MNFLKASVILSFIACLTFTVVCLVMNRFGYEVSDTLIQWFFTVFGVEFAAAAAIRITKYQIKKQEQKDYLESLKANNFDIEKSDIVSTDSNSYDYNDYNGDDYYG